MSMRSTLLNNYGTFAIDQKIDSRYEVIEAVSKYLDQIQYISDTGISELTATLNEALDFTGITVVTGDTPSWDAETKVLTIPVEKGDKGDAGQDGADGADGLTPQIEFSYDSTTGNLEYEVTYA